MQFVTAATLNFVPNPDASGLSGVFLAPDKLAAIEADWRDLWANAVEKNPFYAPFMLRPALAHLGADDVLLACVYDGPLLVGVLPLAPERGYARLPLRYLASVMHEHCFYAAPLVRRGHEAAFFDMLFSMLEKHPARFSFLRLRHIDPDGPLALAALGAAKRARRLAFASGGFERAALAGEYRAADYIDDTIRKKKRKELARLRRRLEEAAGPVRFHRLDGADDLGIWTSMFLLLENAGWKGREGSAIAASRASTQFFREALKAAFAAGALRFYRLDAGPDTIAMIVNFIDSGEGYSFKIAYAPRFARYSPGVMLEIDMLKALEGEGLKFLDSCARADHPMINSLWTGRRRIVGLNIGGRRPLDRAALSAARALEWAREGAAR
ncbi:MAG: GNAT family N-acetyltransferase [Amphiplicatus sp.]